MKSSTIDMADTFRALLDAAMRFEKKAAQERRVEPERQALRDAITHAQLLLSVQSNPVEQKQTTQTLKKPIQAGLPLVAGVRGGKTTKKNRGNTNSRKR